MHGLALALIAVAAAEPVPLPRPPPVSLDDLILFPPPAVVAASLRLADEHLAWLQEMGRFSPYWRDDNGHRLQEARWRREVWYSLSMAQWPSWVNGDDSWRLSRLERLRQALGAEGYYAGRMPAPVPWR